MGVKTIPVNDYVDKLLMERNCITSAEIEIGGDFDYVMLMMVAMEYNSETSPYCLVFSEGQTTIGKYSVPNMVISRNQ